MSYINLAYVMSATIPIRIEKAVLQADAAACFTFYLHKHFYSEGLQFYHGSTWYVRLFIDYNPRTRGIVGYNPYTILFGDRLYAAYKLISLHIYTNKQFIQNVNGLANLSKTAMISLYNLF